MLPGRIKVTLIVELEPKLAGLAVAPDFWEETAERMSQAALKEFFNDQAFTTRVLKQTVAGSPS